MGVFSVLKHMNVLTSFCRSDLKWWVTKLFQIDVYALEIFFCGNMRICKFLNMRACNCFGSAFVLNYMHACLHASMARYLNNINASVWKYVKSTSQKD